LKFDRQLAFHRIGNEGGLLSGSPVEQQELLMAPGERADVIVDLVSLSAGDSFTLLNTGPDEPYQGPKASQEPADPETTGRVMQFRVIAATSEGTPGAIPSTLPSVPAFTTSLPPRDLTLNEKAFLPLDIPVEAQLGTAKDGPLEWNAETTEKPLVGSTEIWRIANLTADAHPIHLHLVMFQVLDRTPFDADAYRQAQRDYLDGGAAQPKIEDYMTGSSAAPDPWESGQKDTVIANPGEVTRIIATFDIAGRYLWHCHILEHEDNEMMRTFEVLPLP
jgi:FtsP/CotA-like multicopper oxidase with cupredoxin domain